MITRMALGRPPPCLDREREDHRRTIGHGIGLGESLLEIEQIMTTEIANRRQQLVIADFADQPPELTASRGRSRVTAV